MRPRVLFIHQSASTVGGVETWMDRISVGLADAGWEPIVGLVRGAKHHDPERYRAAHPGLETVDVDGRGLDREGRIRAVRSTIGRLRPDVVAPLVVVDAHDATAREKLRRPDMRYLLAGHGNVPCQIADYRRVSEFVDVAVGAGRLTARLLEWAGIPPERVRYIPNGARAPIAERRERDARAPIRLGYVGRLTAEDKRVRDIPDFCRALRDRGVAFDLLIAGDGPERATLEGDLADFGNSVRLCGSLSHEELYRTVYPDLDCLLLFSESEAFGIVLLEAQLHGVVPISSRYVGHALEGLVTDGENALLFDIGDVDGAARAVAALAADSARLSALSDAARRQVEGRYDWDRCVGRYVALLNEVRELSPRSGAASPPDPPTRRSDPGRLERWGVPGLLVDGLRRARRRLFGVPDAMVGGEEWPWTNAHYSPEELIHIESAARSLDVDRVGG